MSILFDITIQIHKDEISPFHFVSVARSKALA